MASNKKNTRDKKNRSSVGTAAADKIQLPFRALFKDAVFPEEGSNAGLNIKDANCLYHILFEQSPDIVMVTDAQGKIVLFNEAARLQMGYTEEEFSGSNLSEVGLFRGPGKSQDAVKGIFAANRAEFATLWNTKNGEARNVYVTSQKINLFNQSFFQLVVRDITGQKRAEEALLDCERTYRTLVEGMDDSMYVVDSSYKYVFMNKRHAMRMGLSGREYTGRAYGEFHTPEETSGFINDVNKVFETGMPVRYEYKNRDGRCFAQTLSPVKDTTGKIVTAVISRDITERRKMEEKLLSLSLRDELTGLYNRRGFVFLSEKILDLCKHNRQKAFLLFADLDGLKRINDEFGHEEGDRMLIAAADILKATCRGSDVIARTGGDEFVVVPFGGSADEAGKIIARLENKIRDYNQKNGPGRNLSMSLGVSCCKPDSGCSIDDLVKLAEKSMYIQKNNKRKST